ncbi:pupal cuticle protein Edg-84A-like [Palaemon carinicauda]|uniref:pupal cuticle protein Edg-84A-like n=1 Tax=Palaemon carinicauda TaxID=392227 RepID=UPI0035B5F847
MKAVIFLCVLGVCFCAPQLGQQSGPEEKQRYDPFTYNYIVNDDENTVYATRQETQDVNGVVHGEYSWVAPDGVRYTTTYTADAVNGYNAITRREKTNIEIRVPVRAPAEQPQETIF